MFKNGNGPIKQNENIDNTAPIIIIHGWDFGNLNKVIKYKIKNRNNTKDKIDFKTYFVTEISNKWCCYKIKKSRNKENKT